MIDPEFPLPHSHAGRRRIATRSLADATSIGFAIARRVGGPVFTRRTTATTVYSDQPSRGSAPAYSPRMSEPTVIAPRAGEVVGDAPDRRVEILADHDALHATWSRFGPGREGADLHVHRRHTDVF
jgi:hypothetical protein